MDTHGFLQPDCKPTIKKTENHLSLSIYIDIRVNDRACLSKKPDEAVKSLLCDTRLLTQILIPDFS